MQRGKNSGLRRNVSKAPATPCSRRHMGPPCGGCRPRCLLRKISAVRRPPPQTLEAPHAQRPNAGLHQLGPQSHRHCTLFKLGLHLAVSFPCCMHPMVNDGLLGRIQRNKGTQHKQSSRAGHGWPLCEWRFRRSAATDEVCKFCRVPQADNKGFPFVSEHLTLLRRRACG